MSRARRRLAIGIAAAGALLVAGAAIGMTPTGGELVRTDPHPEDPPAMTLSSYDPSPPGRPLRALFIHHSIGGQLLADPGPDVRRDGITLTHPSGGGLRALLEADGYRVGELTYGSRLGEDTDLFDWRPLFRDHMDAVLRTERQDRPLPAGERNEIVLFKSCFPNSRLVGRGHGEGDPAGPTLTLANARATMRALLPLFAAQPETLFVYLTAPPLAPRLERQPRLERIARRLLGRAFGPEELRRSGRLARELNRWLTAEDGWLAGYEASNVAVFDYWDVLTGEGHSNLLAYYDGDGTDAHPSGEGQRRAAPRLVETLNRSVRRAGLVPSAGSDPRSARTSIEPPEAAAGGGS